MKSTIFGSALLGVALGGKITDYQTINDPVKVPSYGAADLQSLYRSTADTRATN